MKITKKDIKTILKASETLDKIARKYKIKGNLGQIYLEAYNQLKSSKI